MGGGRRARFRAASGFTQNFGQFRFVDWIISPDMNTPPTSAVSSIRVVTQPTGGARTDSGEIVLKKEFWGKVNTGYRYFRYWDNTGSQGGVQYVLYRPGKLVVRFHGPLFDPIVGGVDYVQLTAKIGSKEYCGRFYKSIRNATGDPVVILKGATGPCPAPCPDGFACESFGIVPGFNATDPASNPGDDGHSTWLRVWDYMLAGGGEPISSATNGLFYPCEVRLAKAKSVGPDGRAELRLVEPVVYGGANYPASSFEANVPGKVCVRIWSTTSGWIDCNGGSNADASLTVDSDGPNPPSGPPELTVPAGGDDSGTGAGILPVQLQFVTLNTTMMEDQSWDRVCNTVDYSSVPVYSSAFVTGMATSTVLNGWGNSLDGSVLEPKGTLQVSLSGMPFACSGWGSAGSTRPSLVLPFYSLDHPNPPVLPGGLVEDLALALRWELTRPGTCTDAVRNGKESDRDCGGGECPRCVVGKVCRMNSDCESGYCRYDGVCVAKKP